jgi:hypothetical protein
MKQLLLLFPILLFQLKVLAQYPQNKDSVWIRENRIQSITFNEADRTLYYTFDKNGHILTVKFIDTANYEQYSCNFGAFEYTQEECYRHHSIRKNAYDSLHRIEREFYWCELPPDPPALTGKVDSVISTYRYEKGKRIKNYKGYERSYYNPETQKVHEYNELTYFSADGSDSLIVNTYPLYPEPGDTSSLTRFHYSEGKLITREQFSTQLHSQYKMPFPYFLSLLSQYTYYPNGALKIRIESSFSRYDETENTVNVYSFTEDGYVKAWDYTYFDLETEHMYTSKHTYTEEEIYREAFSYWIEAARANHQCVDITYYR